MSETPDLDAARHARVSRCEMSDLPVEQCACRIHGPSERRPRITRHGMPWEARFPGACEDCERRIHVGDSIMRTEDGYAHEDCHEERP